MISELIRLFSELSEARRAGDWFKVLGLVGEIAQLLSTLGGGPVVPVFGAAGEDEKAELEKVVAECEAAMNEPAPVQASPAGLNPQTIITIVSAVIEIVRWLRQR